MDEEPEGGEAGEDGGEEVEVVHRQGKETYHLRELMSM